MMLENPLIVFVIPGRLGEPPERFPIGWTMDGKAVSSTTQEAGAFSVLLLDDSQSVPEDIGIINCDNSKPLLVVAHKSSKINTSSRILNNPVLMSWGKPYICEAFSHGEGETWEDIKSLVSGKLSAGAFVEKRRIERDLDLYDRLAAICQINLIDPSVDAEEVIDATINQLPRQFRELSRPIWDSEQVDWLQLLDITRAHAAILAR